MLGDLPVWDLSDLYKSHNDKKLSSDIKEVKSISKTFIEKYKGNLEQLNSSQLNEAINYYERINQILGKLYSYASLSFAINTDKAEYGQHYQKIKELGSEIYAQLVFFELEIMNLNKQSSQDHLASNYLKKWGPWLRRIFDRKPYQLSSDLEQFIAEKGPSGRGAWVRLFDESSSDLRFQFRDEVLSETEVLNLLSDTDPEIRKDAGLTFSNVLNQNKRTRSLIINTISRDKFIEDNKRGFKNPISSRNLDNDVEDDVVNALAMAVTNRFSDLSHRYYKLKAKWFGKEKLNWWDRNAPLPNKPSQKWTWNEARNIVLNSFSELSPEIEKIAKKFFDNNWIDAKIRNGKDSGAFSHPCVPDVHPYILMNYNGKSRDVMTLAHELGHGVHQVLSSENGYFLSDTPLTLAETASVFGEMLVFQNLLSQADTKDNKKSMVAEKVEDMLNTVVRQIAFHNFEIEFHNRRKQSELTPDQISEIWMSTQSAALGEAINLDNSYKPLWSYIPHFIHTPFYVYAYAFGDCLVNSLWQVRLSGKKNFTDLYLNLLKSGGKFHHKEALAPFALNASDPEFWNKGLDTISSLIDELET